ncbi:MAG: threonine-phosphate decarboxylase CobD [Paracoccus sp. (in: a-proteobacteria)]|uniref:threonine-phosphate decarboxylase CobD n=1 Tax=Paracoccus sp. TaxID=267 RepID=UPI0026E0F4DA|nr:threonine-phosphate decarboxylase CobD [Paracoccus sp. (in: a-proteobacteria)]MDO5630770.1 threonine-phosphate decarboxylase CobD [Paracoccus sp. (in: a-proteobacteria)]
MQRDHGGNIDAAMARFGGADWIDLSTGINRCPYPVGDLPPQVWQALPVEAARQRLIAAAAGWFGCDAARVLPVAGASAAIQLLPRQGQAGRAAVLWPSYNEHGASLFAAGWAVDQVAGFDAMAGADLAVIVNPNNPDGREWSPVAVAALAETVGHLVVDESFADPRPDLSVAALDLPNVTVLRSFGKFWGLAGLRLGFVIAAPDRLAALAEAAGPWSVNGPALEIGARALADRAWADDAVVYLSEAVLRLDALALRAGWQVVGGTHLFRLYETPDAVAAQQQLARAQIWTRVFPYSRQWLRMGVPGDRDEWDRVVAAFRAM